MKIEIHLIVKRRLSTWTLTLAASLREQSAEGAARPESRPQPRALHPRTTTGDGGPRHERYVGDEAPEREGPANPWARSRKLVEFLLWVFRLVSYFVHRGGFFS